MRNLDNSEDLLDVRDIIARVEELEDERDALDGETYEAWQAGPQADELALLCVLLQDLAGNGCDENWRGDWYPVNLIRDSYFTDYAQELVEDCGYIAMDFPNWIAIDWEATARNVQMDYISTEFGGVTYWYR